MGNQKGIDTHYKNFMHGMNLIPRKMKRVIPFGLTASVAAIILGVALAVKDGNFGFFLSIGHPWTPDGGHLISRKSRFVPGLRNLGNNCFLNVVLQALASCSSFQRFIEQIFEEYDFLGHEGNEKKLPLSCAMASLLENLCTTQKQRSSLNPRNVMVAMEHYMPGFSLTKQQDAEESLLYLVLCLRKELSECYIPNYSSLADVPVLNNARIVTPGRETKESEQQRWSRSFHGPFNGLLCSILNCQSCGFKISLEFQPFQSLHISPMLMNGGFLVDGCSVEACMKQFFGSERLENYFCIHCWHVAAIKYVGLSLTSESETDIQILQQCSEDDSCQCKNLVCVRSLPWSNRFSKCFKQLSIARSPQILCIHVQRASANSFGEVHKLLGHISFPFILDLSPFTKCRLAPENVEKKSQSRLPHPQNELPIPYVDNLSVHLDTGLRDCDGKIPKDTSLEAEITRKNVGALNTESEDKDYSNSVISAEPKRSFDKLLETDSPSSSSDHTSYKYRLVSVVEHFGHAGGGHYTVYRRVRTETSNEDPIALLEPAHAQWFRISDTEVERVSEKDVLDAEASLLFYEKIL